MAERTLVSAVWGGAAKTVSQEFNVNLPNIDDSDYAYVADYGLPYGNHGGLDVAMDAGTDIHAADGGTVIRAGESDSFRPYPVWVLEDDGQVAIYGHLRSDTVKEGDTVAAGQVIGQSGQQTVRGQPDTPDDSGEHLHFELREPDPKVPNHDLLGLFGWKIIDPEPELTGAAAGSGSGSGGLGSGPISGALADVLPFGGIGTAVVLLGAVVATVAAIGLVAGGN